MDIYAHMLAAPKFIRDEKGSRSLSKDNTGVFTISTRLPSTIWQTTKPYASFRSAEDVEDMGGIEGWTYGFRALFVLAKAGHKITLNGIVCVTAKELFDACESIPPREAAAAQAEQERIAALKAERTALAEQITATGLTECSDWSWDDFGYSVRGVIAESEHYVAREYWTTREPDLRNTNLTKKQLGFVVKEKK